jgi:hypothetical protein
MGNFLFDTDYANLGAALTAAAGQVLVISADHTTATPYTVPANTHLLGDGGSIAVTVGDVNALVIGGDGVTIEGVELIGPSSGSTPSAITNANGIEAEGRDNLTVSDCLIRRFDSCGILLLGCRNASLRGNRLYDNRYELSSAADICLYSSDPAGGRVVIAGNFCLSNNSQGIFVDALGYDDDVAVLGNVCIATDSGGDEVDSESLVRRHGIMVGYNSPVDSNGRIVVSGNICRNSQWTGIYLASDDLRRGIVITGNICALNGFEQDTALAGGIYVNGGGVGTLIADNAVCDFRGNPAQYVGSIVVNHTIEGATATLSGNVCDTSSADGIMLKGSARGVHVLGNRTYAIARCDVVEVPSAGQADFGGSRIELNQFVRTNSDAQSVAIQAQDSTRTTYVLGNRLTGFDNEDSGDANAGIVVVGGVGTKPVVAIGNVIEGFHKGIVNYGYLTGRYDALLRFDRNEIRDCAIGMVLGATSEAAVMVVEGNRFIGVATPLSGAGGGLGGYNAGYIGRRDGSRLVLLGLNAAPAIGTWAIGDRAEFTSPSAGGNIGAVCTAAGNAGTWKVYGAIAA